jgi:uncharacterized membrane protein YsdA (DUF1294 family)
LLMISLIGVVLWNANLSLYPAWVLAASIVTFCCYGFDKLQSQRKGWRVPELWLHTLAFGGGFLGGWAGMFWFLHKTKHVSFLILLILATLLHIGLLNAGLLG